MLRLSMGVDLEATVEPDEEEPGEKEEEEKDGEEVDAEGDKEEEKTEEAESESAEEAAAGSEQDTKTEEKEDEVEVSTPLSLHYQEQPWMKQQHTHQKKHTEFHSAKYRDTNSTTLKYCSVAFI